MHGRFQPSPTLQNRPFQSRMFAGPKPNLSVGSPRHHHHTGRPSAINSTVSAHVPRATHPPR